MISLPASEMFQRALSRRLSVFLVLFVCMHSGFAAQYGYGDPSEVLTTAGGRVRGARDRMDKDFVLGGLFPIHSDESGGGRCGAIRLERGLERMEAMLYAIDRINQEQELLGGLQLGYDIRDTCNSENIGLDETIDLIITGSDLDIASCQSTLVSSSNATDGNEGIVSAPTSGVVGAAASSVSVPVASLVRLFKTPQVSYASSSAILSNRDRYEYFYRTISPDNLQAAAMIDLMKYFNWTYVSTIYDRNPYGEPGIDELHALAMKNEICIDLDKGIDDDFTEEDFDSLRDEIIKSTANIVVLFTNQNNAEKILSRIHASPARTRFTWIASDAWARSITTVHNFNETATGLFGFAPLTFNVENFHSYFSKLTIESNRRNPWFPDFYAAFVNCTLNSTCDTNKSITQQPNYEQGNIIPLVIDAVYTFAHALQDFLDANCEQPLQWFRANRTCKGQKNELNGEQLLQYISNVSFDSPTTNKIVFSEQGNVEGRYNILNYQAESTGSGHNYFFASVGVWDSFIAATLNGSEEALQLTDGMTIQFGLDEDDAIVHSPTISHCGQCKSGEYRRQIESSCCGICEPCLGQEYSMNPQANSCLLCPQDYWGNNPLTGSDGCVEIEETHLDYSHPGSIVVVIIACFGLIAVAVVAVGFGIYWKSPVVKSSGREQMVLLLIGIGSSFALGFFFVAPPSLGICLIQRLGLWLCFSLMFGSLLVKIIRVARIFLRGASVTRIRFAEPVYQVIFTLIIVFVQLLIVIASLIYTHPGTDTDYETDGDDFPTKVTTCVSDIEAIPFLILSLLYETALLVVLTILGSMSFKYPENFNEARYIAFCSFSLVVVWIAFILTYLATQSEALLLNVCISLAITVSAFVVLVMIFGPKLVIIIFLPDRNTKSLSTHHRRDHPSQEGEHSVTQSIGGEYIGMKTLGNYATPSPVLRSRGDPLHPQPAYATNTPRRGQPNSTTSPLHTAITTTIDFKGNSSPSTHQQPLAGGQLDKQDL